MTPRFRYSICRGPTDKSRRFSSPSSAYSGQPPAIKRFRRRGLGMNRPHAGRKQTAEQEDRPSCAERLCLVAGELPQDFGKIIKYSAKSDYVGRVIGSDRGIAEEAW